MLSSLHYLLLSAISASLAHCRGDGEPPTKRDLIILTDMEPDDRIALAMVASQPELAKRLLFVGTTLLNTNLKAALVRRQLEQTGLGHVKVFAGTGGRPSSYPNQVATAKAALKFWGQEGDGILPKDELEKYKDVVADEDIFLAERNERSSLFAKPYEEMWSAVIAGIPESTASKPAEKYKEDEQMVIRLLDLLDVQIPPKVVYRMPKPRGKESSPGPRWLKVLFPTGYSVPLLMTMWLQNHKRIRMAANLPQLFIYSGLQHLKKVKTQFVNGLERRQKRAVNENEEGGNGGEVEEADEEKFFDAKEQLEQEEENGAEDNEIKEETDDGDEEFYEMQNISESDQQITSSDQGKIEENTDKRKKKRNKKKNKKKQKQKQQQNESPNEGKNLKNEHFDQPMSMHVMPDQQKSVAALSMGKQKINLVVEKEEQEKMVSVSDQHKLDMTTDQLNKKLSIDQPKKEEKQIVGTTEEETDQSKMKQAADQQLLTEKSTNKIDQTAKSDQHNVQLEIPADQIADLDLDLLRTFLTYEEEERSIFIKRLPEYGSKLPEIVPLELGKIRIGNEKEDPPSPPPLPSQRYRWDFDAALDLLFAIGVETVPLAVRRLGYKVDVRGQRDLQVIFRSKKLVRIVMRKWEQYSKNIRTRSSKPQWRFVIFKEFYHKNLHLSESQIEKQKYALHILGHILKNSEFHGQPVNDDNVKKEAPFPSSSSSSSPVLNDLQKALKDAFSVAEANSLEILLMTAPIDLVQVLWNGPDLARAIRRVHLMGGWVELKNAENQQQQQPETAPQEQSPAPTIWGNYNLNMAPQSSRRLFAMASEGRVPMRLYTYRHVWEMFEGSVNSDHFEEALQIIAKSESPVLEDFLIAAKNWDENAMKVMPYLSIFIGKFAGHQFSPADPILVAGMLNYPEDFIYHRRSVSIRIEQQELDSLKDVLEVQIEYDRPTSKIELITGLRKDVFRRILGQSLGKCVRATGRRRG